MKRFIAVACCFVLFMFSPAAASGGPEAVFQVSTINALNEGIFDGNFTFKELRKRGDFGIGTFNGLDGEMVGLDGKFYQIKANGLAYPVNDTQKTPFALVKFFRSEKAIYLERAYNYERLVQYLDSVLASRNLPYAVKIDGLFAYVMTRSVSRQAKPYGRLTEALKTQTVFEYRNVRGSMVGFRFPEYMRGVNTPGYHFHFISEDRKFGGHLLGCETQDIRILLDDIKRFDMVLPEAAEFLKTDLMKESEPGFRDY